MDHRADIRQFLSSRRARITPERAGLSDYGERRRVPGLRRGEVALLASISVEYYTRLERGGARRASDDVLHAIARALQLDDLETEHLMDLFRTADPPRATRRRATPPKVRPGVQLILDSMTGAAAFVRNARLDLLAANALGHALYEQAFSEPAMPPNLARFVFLDPRSRDFYRNWDSLAADSVGNLRTEAARDPHDKALIDLVGELSTRSDDFRVRWAAHPVRRYRSGTQPFHHHLVGDLTLIYEVLELVTDPGLFIVAYTAEPGSPSQEDLSLLASWTATPEPPPAAGDRRGQHDETSARRE
ncbi:MAG: helix-turn-helix domain-containing protein [Acidimicrobiales bacterium]